MNSSLLLQPDTLPSAPMARRDFADAAERLGDGATVLVGGFGDSGIPFQLLDMVRQTGARDLTIVSINAGRGDEGISGLINSGQCTRIICSFPRTAGSVAFERAYAAGRIELELVPMGTLVERLRAGGAGISAFYTRVAAGTLLARAKEVREFDGVPNILETAIRGDIGLVRANRADSFGNLDYRGVARNLNPVVAKAARLTVAEVDEILEPGAIDPAAVVTSGAYVDRLVLHKGERP